MEASTSAARRIGLLSAIDRISFNFGKKPMKGGRPARDKSVDTRINLTSFEQ